MVEETKSFFAGVITQSKLMLERSAEQVCVLAVKEEFRPAAAKVDRRVPNLEAVSLYTQHSWTSPVTQRMTVSPNHAKILGSLEEVAETV